VADAPSAWLLLRVEVPEPLADAFANFLLEEGAPGLETCEAGTGDDAPPTGRTRIDAPVPAAIHARVQEALVRYATSLAAVEPLAREVSFTSAPVPAVDWNAIYRRHHQPVAVGRRLLIVPPWVEAPSSEREVLVIEPGMAFGTGQHATTRGCLETIEAAVLAGHVGSALDVGTGSGILALALARLGVPRVVAFDVDRAVLPLARETLARNAAPQVLLYAGTAAAVRGPFDLVVANLLADAVIDEAPTLAAAVGGNGRLVLSGLLDTQVDRVLAAYPAWRIAARRDLDSWATLTLVRAG
jgi:ribosomal protein L11 methyltransferase